MVRTIAFAAAWLALAAPASAGSARLYTVARMASALDDAQVVGAKRAGALCLPNGTIRWGDVGIGTAMDQRGIVQDTLEDADVPVTPLGIGLETAPRLRGTVTGARFEMCARHWLGGDRKALSGDASLRIEWRLEGLSGGAVPIHVSAIARRFDTPHAAPLGTLYRLLLIDAARDAATWLKGL